MSKHNSIQAKKVSVLENSHSNKRESRLGRWAPARIIRQHHHVVKYWHTEGTWNLLPLVLLPLIAFTLYLAQKPGGTQ